MRVCPCGLYGKAIGLIDLDWLEFPIQQDQQHTILFLLSVNGGNLLAPFAAVEDAATFDPESMHGSTILADGVVTVLPDASQP